MTKIDWLHHEETTTAEEISALQAQEAKTQLSAEGTTSDLISRQAAIEVIEEMQMPIMRSMFPEEQFVFKGMSEALSAIKDLPSAHPEIEERKEESAQNVPKEDLISRNAAIDYCYQLINVEHQQGSDEMNYGQERVNQTEAILHHLEFMPSAQPEPLVNESRTLVKDLVKDTISRQEAIDVCDNAIDLWHGQLGEGIVIAVKKKIEELLPAQPEIEERKEESAQNVPKEDLISRKAAIDAMSETLKRVFPEHRQIAEKCLNVLPSAQPEPQWIPVSKKSHPDTPERVQVQLDNGWIITACYEENEWLSVPDFGEAIKDKWVEAWMPLPEPYRAERRTDEGD